MTIKKPYDRPVLERKPGFERGAEKPHIAKRVGFWYAFKRNPFSAVPECEYEWAATTKGRDETLRSVADRSLESLHCPLFSHSCNYRNIQLRGLLS